MWQRNQLFPNQHLTIRVTKKTEVPVLVIIKIAVAGKVKGIGKRTGVKRIREKGSLLYLSLISKGYTNTRLPSFATISWYKIHVFKIFYGFAIAAEMFVLLMGLGGL